MTGSHRVREIGIDNHLGELGEVEDPRIKHLVHMKVQTDPSVRCRRQGVRHQRGPVRIQMRASTDQVDADIESDGQRSTVSPSFRAGDRIAGERHDLDIHQVRHPVARLANRLKGVFASTDVDVRAYRRGTVRQEQPEGIGGPVGNLIRREESIRCCLRPGFDGPHQIPSRVRHPFSGEGLVQMGVRLGHGSEQQPTVELFPGGSRGYRCPRVDDSRHRTFDNVDVDQTPVAEMSPSQHPIGCRF